MILRDTDNILIRLKIIKSFTDHARSLTVYQVWKKCEEQYDISIIKAIIEELVLTGLITKSGYTKCQWTRAVVETFHYEETT